MVGEGKLNLNSSKGDYEITTTSFKVTKNNLVHIDERPKNNKNGRSKY